MAGCKQRKNPFINALLNKTNTVILSDKFHTISGAAKSDSDSDDNKSFVKDRLKKKNTLSPRLGVIDDNKGSQFDGDTSVIMLGRPLYHHIPWDLRYGPCLAIMKTSIRKYTAFTMMVIIRLWMYHGEARQLHKHPKENPQHIFFSEWEGGNRASSSSENHESHLADALDWRFAIRK